MELIIPGTLNYKNKSNTDKQLSIEEKPFIAWDGEGITYEDSPQQAYVLLANSLGDYICAPEGQSLTTVQCLEKILEVEARNPKAIHIGYGFSYDTNQILNSFSKKEVWGLNEATRKGYSYRWRRYSIKIHPGKLFRVTRGRYRESLDYQSATIYDTLGFFQTKFLELVRKFRPDLFDQIQSGKDDRGKFRYCDISSIIEYCLGECRILAEILEDLRCDFEKRGLFLKDWYGPGAVANISLKNHNIKSYKGIVPEQVAQASRFAYQGGRFELLRAGYYPRKVWQYDINSAYPSAIVGLPDLSEGVWEFKKEYEPETFGIWNVDYRNRSNGRQDRYCRYRAQPFFYRNSKGCVAYPTRVIGWYWTPEVESCIKSQHPYNLDIRGGWVFRNYSDIQPFKYIEDIYYERLEMKKRKDPTERVLKLEMNSVYGKFAQRSGYFKPGDKIPSYHQLEWAGYITSATRAKIYEAYNISPGTVFSFETDALFSLEPLNPLPVGNRLGQWTVKEYSDILYLQSGFYFAGSAHSAVHSGSSAIHYRGFDKGSLKFENVMEWLETINPLENGISVISGKSDNQPKLYGPSKRFIGFKRALMSRNAHYWRSWEETPREITIGRDGKRVHMVGCPSCRHGNKFTKGLHSLIINPLEIEGTDSYQHKIPWVNHDFGNIWVDEEDVGCMDAYAE